ncbi:MAG: PLDc N-terminal domain-containing protein [Bacteroidota bacterium]
MTFLFFFGAGILLTLFIILFVILLPLLALISVLMNDFRGNDKLMWVVVIIFLPFLGSVLYFLVGRDRRINR